MRWTEGLNWSVAVLGLTVCLWEQSARPVAHVAIRAGRFFDGKSDRLLSDQVVLIEGNRITGVGASDRVKIPPEAKEIGLNQATVLPGLIDTLTHRFLTGESGGRYDEQP